MKRGLYLSITLALGTTAISMADDVLDAKLNALKNKAQRRTYSTYAILNDQDLVVPQAATDEEKALDEKLRRMNKELDAQPAMMTRQISPQRAIARPAQAEPVNWLTPALFNKDSAENSPTQTGDDSWILEELTRQKNIKLEKLSKAEEKKLVDQRLREDRRGGTTAPRSPLNSYSASLQDILSGGAATPASRQASPQGLRAPYSTQKTSARTPSGSTVPTPSFRSSFAPVNNPEPSFNRRSSSSAAQLPQLPQNIYNTPSSSPSKQNPAWQTQDPPQNRSRRTSPTYKANPFDEDLMPNMKKSIWD